MEILLVDDSKEFLSDLSQALIPTGYTYISVNDPLMAISLVKKHPFDMVISDMKMHPMSGLDLLRQVKAINKDIPVILITAFTDFRLSVDTKGLPVDYFLNVPINFKKLVQIIEETDRKIPGRTTH